MTTTATKDDCIRAYTDAGFDLFPCTIDKRPALKGWQQIPTPEILPDVFGVRLTHEIVVLDYDSRRDPNGNQLSELWRVHGLPYADTCIIETANGFHIYYAKPVDVYVRNRVPDFNAIDVKTGGGYVIGAGSTREDFTYTVVRGSLDQLQEIPAGLLNLIRFDRDAILADQQELETDDADTQRVFTAYCSTQAPAAVEGSGGDGVTFQVACVGRDYGLSEPVVLEIMDAFYNTAERCVPTWQYDELAAKVANAFSYAQNKQGYRSPDAKFDGIAEKIDIKRTQTATVEVLQDVETPTEYGLKWSYEIDRTTGDKVFKPNVCNVISFVKLDPMQTENPLNGLFRFNDFAKEIEFTRPAPWHRKDWQPKFFTDADALLLMQYFSHKNLHISKEKIIEGVWIASQNNAYHPLRDYLRGLEWDGVNRLESFHSKYMGSADNLHTREAGRLLFIGAIARAMNPGCQFDVMLIWEGRQGTYKSSAVKALGEAPGEGFYGDVVIDPKNKETQQNIQGLWFIEVSEMASYKKAEVDQFKRFITLKTDRIMKKYDRMTSDLPRGNVMVGTINPGTGGYLADDENRRFLPIETGVIDIDGIIEDRDQLFAEAFVRYMGGEKPYTQNEQVKAMQRQEQTARMMQDEWVSLIEDWLSNDAKLLNKPLTTANLALYALNIQKANIGRMEQIRIAKAMQALGYHNDERMRIEGKQIRVWLKSGKVNVDYI